MSSFSKVESPTLDRAITSDFVAIFNEGLNGSKIPDKFPYSELLTNEHEQYGIKWHPLVTTESKLICELSILMLRPNDHKSVVQSGDIDGRVKTIFDSLCIPTNGIVLKEFPTHDGNFYTLLSDDSLISKVNVDTDELLQLKSNQHDNHAQLIIEVNTRLRNEPYIHL